MLIYDIVDKILSIIMSMEKNTDINRKKQQDIEAKENEIEEALENVSDKTKEETKKEASKIGDSDTE